MLHFGLASPPTGDHHNTRLVYTVCENRPCVLHYILANNEVAPFDDQNLSKCFESTQAHLDGGNNYAGKLLLLKCLRIAVIVYLNMLPENEEL